MKHYLWEKVEKMGCANMENLVFNSELNFNEQVYQIAQRIFDTDCYKLVLVAGPSSSGKTTFTKLLSNRLQYLGVKVHFVSTDDYFINRDEVPYLPSGIKDYDSLAAMDVPLLKKTFQSILNSDWIEVPTYDFISGTRGKESNLLKLHNEDVVIVEGIHALNDELLENRYDERICRISIEPRTSFLFEDGTELMPNDLRLLRRCIRDFHTRGHSLEATFKQWAEVRRAEDIYIKPYTAKADFRVDSTYAYELFVYKYCIFKQLCEADAKGYETQLKALTQVPYIPIPTIPKESLLNEFAIMSKK